MTFYQELQLNQAGSKLMIQEAVGRRAKAWHLLVYLVKILLTMVFCVAFVTLYGWVFGAENNIVGVVVLLCLMVFRQADLGMRRGQSLLALGLVFLVLAFGPRLANLAELGGELAVHGLSLLVILVLGCHNVIMSNHSTFVLSYLLLQGYDVSGADYEKRIVGLLLGMVICMAVFYKNQRLRPYRRSFLDLFREFHFRSARNWWYIRMTLTVSTALLIMNLLGISRAMWAGIACMSVCLPFSGDMQPRAKTRGLYNVLGCAVFAILYFLLPQSLHPYLGILGGIGVGYSAGYAWQTVFNTFGALYIASGAFGLVGAIALRIGTNVGAAAYTMLLDQILNRLFGREMKRREGYV